MCIVAVDLAKRRHSGEVVGYVNSSCGIRLSPATAAWRNLREAVVDLRLS